MLGPEQLPGVGAGPVEQGHLDEQFRADIPGVAGRLAQPFFGGLAARGRGLQQRPGRPLATGLLLGRHDQAELLQPLRGAVDHGLPHVPDPAQAAVFGQQARDREAVRGSLTDQAQHQPFGQRQSRVALLRHHGSTLTNPEREITT